MKKNFALLLTVLLLTLSLTACGGGNKTNNGTTNDGLLNDTGDVLEDIGNGAGEALQDTGRALTGNNGTANRNGMY